METERFGLLTKITMVVGRERTHGSGIIRIARQIAGLIAGQIQTLSARHPQSLVDPVILIGLNIIVQDIVALRSHDRIRYDQLYLLFLNKGTDRLKQFFLLGP